MEKISLDALSKIAMWLYSSLAGSKTCDEIICLHSASARCIERPHGVLGHFLFLWSLFTIRLPHSYSKSQGHFIQTHVEPLAGHAGSGWANCFFPPWLITYCMDISTHIHTHRYTPTFTHMSTITYINTYIMNFILLCQGSIVSQCISCSRNAWHNSTLISSIQHLLNAPDDHSSLICFFWQPFISPLT